MKTKNKPKYWVVKNDESQLFKNTVIKKLNEIDYNSLNPWTGKEAYTFYGYDGNGTHRGTNSSNSTESFENNPTLLTLEEFITLFTEPKKEKLKAGDVVLVRDSINEKWKKGTYIHTLERDGKGRYIVEVKGISYVHWDYMKVIPKHTMEELTKIVGYDFEIKE